MSTYKDIKKRIKSVSQSPEYIKAIFYGKAGTGKTSLLGTFPAVLHLDIREKGSPVLKKVKGLKTLEIKEWSDLQDIYWYLRKEDHDFETVGIDTAGNAQMLAVEEVMKKHKKKGNPGDWGTMSQQMWGEVASMCKELFLDFRDLDMNVVFIAHDRVFKAQEDDDDNGDVVRIAPHIGPALSPAIASTLNAAVNVIGETFIGEKVKIEKDKKSGKKIEIKSTEYYLRIGPNSSYITKVRKPKEIKLPDVIKDPEYEDLMEFMK